MSVIGLGNGRDASGRYVLETSLVTEESSRDVPGPGVARGANGRLEQRRLSSPCVESCIEGKENVRKPPTRCTRAQVHQGGRGEEGTLEEAEGSME